MNKIKHLVVIQCRFGSTRLHGKALFPLCGIPIVAFLIRRLKNKLPKETYQVILATTRKKEDDIVSTWGKYEGAQVVRGAVDDILSRYIQCLKEFPATTIVRVTADNPLTCPEVIVNCVSLLKLEKLDYVQSGGTPYGAGVDVFSTGIMEYLHKHVKNKSEREHINKYILNHPKKFMTKRYTVEGNKYRPDIRLTIDTFDDWQKINRILDQKDNEPWNIHLDEAIARMDLFSVCATSCKASSFQG